MNTPPPEVGASVGDDTGAGGAPRKVAATDSGADHLKSSSSAKSAKKRATAKPPAQKKPAKKSSAKKSSAKKSPAQSSSSKRSASKRSASKSASSGPAGVTDARRTSAGDDRVEAETGQPESGADQSPWGIPFGLGGGGELPELPDFGDVGEFIRNQREMARLSVRRLAELANVSNPYLSQVERGLRKPSADILQQVANALRISVESLYVRAGILPDQGVENVSSVPEAIEHDQRLTDEQKMALRGVYDSFVNG